MAQNGLPPIAAVAQENVWLDALQIQDGEQQFQAMIAAQRRETQRVRANPHCKNAKPTSSLASEIANCRERIKSFLKTNEVKDSSSTITIRISRLENKNAEMNEKLLHVTSMLEKALSELHQLGASFKALNILPEKDKCNTNQVVVTNGPSNEDDIDLFGSDEETEEEAKLKAERLKAYEDKKAKKTAVVAKSSVVLDVKPWDDETDMKALEAAVRKIATDGLTWGAGKLVPLAYGISKLQIVAIVEDEKVSIDWLQEAIQENEELVQSVDIAAFNKL